MEFACYNDWRQLPEGVERLFQQVENDSIFLSRRWFECLSRHISADAQQLVLACVHEADEVLAVLPLLRTTGTHNYYALKHGFTPVYTLLLSHTAQPDVVSFLAQSLQQLPIHGLLLEPVAEADNSMHALSQALQASGFHCEYRFRHYNWVHRLNDQCFVDYMAQRPAQLRNTIARKQRKLEREHGYEIRLYNGTDALLHMADYYTVYNASWKQNEISNAAFQDCIVDTFSHAGWSRLGVLYVSDRPIAAQLWFVHHGRANIFRLAYDKAWRAASPGSILTHFMLQYVIDTDKVHEIDFLTGNDAYKQDWMTERRQRYLLSCVNTARPEGLAARILAALGLRLKRR